MTLTDAVAALLFAGVTAYALFGGADFGTGFWDLTAGGDRAGGPLRDRIDRSLAPVWEANHVWLIFVLVFLWTGFPRGFAAIVTTLPIPLVLALVGIVLRGAGFAFRKFSATVPQARLFGVAFALSSLVTPFFLGAAVGGIVAGRVPAAGSGDRWTSWTGPTSVLGGVIAMLACAYLAGVLLTADADRDGEPALVAQMRRRLLVLAVVTGATVLAGVVVLREDSPTLVRGLLGRALPIVLVSAAGGAASAGALWMRRYRMARLAAGTAVGAVVVAWGVAQYPWLLVDRARLAEVAGARSTLRALVVVGAFAALVVLPSLAWLLRLVDERER